MVTRRCHDVSGLCLEWVHGSIERQFDLDAVLMFLTPARAAGELGTAFPFSHRAGCVPFRPVRARQTAITSFHAFHNAFVVYCTGPVFDGEEATCAELDRSYSSAVAAADRHRITSLAVPGLPPSDLGFPLVVGASIALTAVKDQAPALDWLRLIRFVLPSEADCALLSAVFQELCERKLGGDAWRSCVPLLSKMSSNRRPPASDLLAREQ